MPTLERHYELGTTSQVAALPEADEARARRDLRDQIAALEAQLGAAVSAEFPHLPVPRSGTSGAAARLLDLGALEGVRDQLADRLLALRREAEALGARQAASRRLLERMRLEPGRHRWVRVYAADLGQPGCQSWQARPRFGLLGMLMGWWRVKLSSGCPLAGRPSAYRGLVNAVRRPIDGGDAPAPPGSRTPVATPLGRAARGRPNRPLGGDHAHRCESGGPQPGPADGRAGHRGARARWRVPRRVPQPGLPHPIPGRGRGAASAEVNPGSAVQASFVAGRWG